MLPPSFADNLAISEIKGIKKRDIDSLTSDLNLTKLAKLIMDSNWDEIKAIL